MFRSQARLISSALLLLSLLSLPVAKCPAQASDSWILVAPAGEGFSVRVPAKPEEQTDRVPMMGNTYLMRMYTSVDEKSGILHMVVMQEFASVAGILEPSKRMDRFVEGFKEGMAKSLAGVGAKLELTLERDLNLKGHGGRQYKLLFGESPGLVRVYDGSSRMYVLVVMGGDEKNPSVGRFFDSFDIVPAPAPVPKPISTPSPVVTEKP